jgi:hypothetical protein
MGTKNQPGSFDCYANAAPDEPMFVLLARDPSAALLVELWCTMRRNRKALDFADSKETEAKECAESMRRWREDHEPSAASEAQRIAIREKVIEAAGILATMLFVDGIVRDRTMANMSEDVKQAVWKVAEASFELDAATR